MSRIKAKPIKQYPWYVRWIFWLQKRHYGAILDSSKLWGRSPSIFTGLSLFYSMINRKSSPVPARLRSLISVEVAKIIQCPFCVDINSAIFINQGEDKKTLEHIEDFQTSPLFSDREKAALSFAKAMSFTPNQVTDEIFANLQQYFCDDEIVELTALIAFQNCSSRFNTSLKIPLQGFQKS